jgi:hypothetical protein
MGKLNKTKILAEEGLQSKLDIFNDYCEWCLGINPKKTSYYF